MKISNNPHITRMLKNSVVLPLEEEAELARRYQAGDQKAGQELIAANVRFVVKTAHSFSRYNMDLDELVQEGNLGLTVAAQRFEYTRGYKFITYAVWWIRAYITQYIIKNWSLVKIGTTGAERKLFFKLRQAHDEAFRALGREPDEFELAEKLDVRPQDIVNVQSRLAGRDFYLNAKVHGKDDDGENKTHLDALMSDLANPEEVVIRKELSRKIQERIDASRFSAREMFLIRERLMNDEPKALHDIGQQDFGGVSRERVRQIEARLVDKLKVALN